MPGPGTTHSVAAATIALDAASDGGNNGGTGTNLTWSHTCTGSNRILFVGVVGDVITGGVDDVSSITYNGAGMTLAAKRTVEGSSNRFIYLYYLIAPATGSNSVSVDFSSSHFILAGAISYTGAKQSAQPDATANSNAGSNVTSWATSVTVVANNSWAIVVEQGFNSSNLPAAGTGSTLRQVDAAFGTMAMFDSNGPLAAGSRSMTTTRTTAPTSWISHVMVSFAPL